MAHSEHLHWRTLPTAARAANGRRWRPLSHEIRKRNYKRGPLSAVLAIEKTYDVLGREREIISIRWSSIN